MLYCLAKDHTDLIEPMDEFGDAATAHFNTNSDDNFSKQLTDSIVSHPEPIGDETSIYPERSGDRSKRALVFRPLFIYRQQQVRKQRLDEKHKRDQSSVDGGRRITANPQIHTQFINPPNRLLCRYGQH